MVLWGLLQLAIALAAQVVGLLVLVALGIRALPAGNQAPRILVVHQQAQTQAAAVQALRVRRVLVLNGEGGQVVVLQVMGVMETMLVVLFLLALAAVAERE